MSSSCYSPASGGGGLEPHGISEPVRAAWKLISSAGNLVFAMDDEATYQDSELPRSSYTAAAVVSVSACSEP